MEHINTHPILKNKRRPASPRKRACAGRRESGSVRVYGKYAGCFHKHTAARGTQQPGAETRTTVEPKGLSEKLGVNDRGPPPRELKKKKCTQIPYT